MKNNCIIFAVFTLGVMAKGTWWAAALHPVILGFGAIFTALNEDLFDDEPFNFENWLHFNNKSDTKGNKDGREGERILAKDDNGRIL